jgi:hypothetical protein
MVYLFASHRENTACFRLIFTALGALTWVLGQLTIRFCELAGNRRIMYENKQAIKIGQEA